MMTDNSKEGLAGSSALAPVMEAFWWGNDAIPTTELTCHRLTRWTIRRAADDGSKRRLPITISCAYMEERCCKMQECLKNEENDAAERQRSDAVDNRCSNSLRQP